MNATVRTSSPVTGARDSDAGWSVGGIEDSAIVRTAYGIISITGIIGNTLICLILLRFRHMRTSTSYFVVHLSVVDLLSCIMVVPVHLFPSPPSMAGKFGDFVCRFYVSKYVMWTCILVSVGSLVLINLERFVAIVYPLKYKRLYTTRKITLMLMACWLYALVHNSFFFAVYELKGPDVCQYVGFPSLQVQIVYALYHLFVYYAGPLGFMLVSNWKMVNSLRSKISRLNSQTDRADKKKLWHAQAAHELQKTLVLVVITYGICWGLNQTMFFCFLLTVPIDFTQPYYHFGVILGVCNSCVNPLIYTVKNKSFRNGLKALVLPCREQQVQDLPTATTGISLAVSNEEQGVANC
ncbi:neuropeptide SIFamide receptor-like [Asterias rubens]|uniref:neuropeptide SIFamide receptor-like n=1 Tax=Asterias rubens TaxID=7604 RepID=UPI0014555D55|nr:neuropeptide SIFamide receptor-like [Asterias rubens]